MPVIEGGKVIEGARFRGGTTEGAGGTATADLAPGILAASALGRALMATGYFNAATVAAKFGTDSFTAAVLLQLIADGAFAADAPTLALFADGLWTTAKLAAATRGNLQLVPIEDLGAGVDIAARAVFVAPAGGATLTKIGIIPQGASAAIDDANTAVVAVADGAANVIVSKTYNTAGQPPAANAYASLGALDATHKILTANEVVTIAVTQGAAADLPACLLVIEWDPA